MTIARKTIGSIISFIVIMVVLLWGKPITNTIEAHHWVGVVLLLCAIAFVLWGMFWRKEETA